MRKTRNWKHNTKERKQYGKRNLERYQSEFMTLDEEYLKEDEEDTDGRLV